GNVIIGTDIDPARAKTGRKGGNNHARLGRTAFCARRVKWEPLKLKFLEVYLLKTKPRRIRL
ncbi:MAG: hypothetical protein LBH43_06010, partial [Treponema sp.]|nr:hypothetical protein [Treponema sp.]